MTGAPPGFRGFPPRDGLRRVAVHDGDGWGGGGGRSRAASHEGLSACTSAITIGALRMLGDMAFVRGAGGRRIAIFAWVYVFLS